MNSSLSQEKRNICQRSVNEREASHLINHQKEYELCSTSIIWQNGGEQTYMLSAVSSFLDFRNKKE